MKRKLIIVLLSLVCALCLAFGLFACYGTSNSGTSSGSEQTGGNTDDSGETVDGTESDSWSNGVYTLKTAYAEAQDLGYSGTLEEFIDLISGDDGTDGIGILDIEINSSGELVIYLTDSTSKNLGKISTTCEHVFGEWTVGAEATCTSIGYQSRVCTECGYTEYQFTEATGHTYATAVAASAYYTHMIKCTTCNEIITQTHIYNSDYVCEVCNYHYYSEGLTFSVCYDDDGNISYGVSCGVCVDSNIIIPSVYNGYPVTQINNSAFSGCVSLTSINIPTSVTTIGGNAFYNCASLTSIVIPDSVTSIGSWVFYNCTLLADVTMGSGVSDIGNYAFDCCSSLESFEVSSANISYKSVDGNLYSSDGTILMQYAIAKSATTFTIPDGVAAISESAFRDCENLVNVLLPEGLVAIENYAFMSCSALKNITIPDSVTSIGSQVFLGCLSLTSINVNYGNTAYKSIDGNLYNYDGTKLMQYAVGRTDTSFTIPSGVTTIGDRAFWDCTSIESITISGNVVTIEEAAFWGCSSLTNVTFENSSGWRCASDMIDVTNTSNNATYLTDTYLSYTWYRSDN